MSFVTSFIPGRIRLRSRIFKDNDIASAFESLLDATGIVKGIERNAETGSILVKYDAEKLPTNEDILSCFSSSIPELSKLRVRIMYYTPKDKAWLLSVIDKAKEAMPEVKDSILKK